jgi:hypothetical protein
VYGVTHSTGSAQNRHPAFHTPCPLGAKIFGFLDGIIGSQLEKMLAVIAFRSNKSTLNIDVDACGSF